MELVGSLMAQTAAASEQRMLRLADDFDSLRHDFYALHQRVGAQQQQQHTLELPAEAAPLALPSNVAAQVPSVVTSASAPRSVHFGSCGYSDTFPRCCASHVLVYHSDINAGFSFVGITCLRSLQACCCSPCGTFSSSLPAF
jgi:hypothetical protein